MKRLVIFADPDYDHLSSAAGAPQPGRAAPVATEALFPPLPGTEREAVFLAAEAKRDGLEARVYRGAGASKANLAGEDSPYVLHLATHGLYLSEDDMPSLPVPAGSDGPILAGQPMTRSLLALAGAAVTLRDWKRGIFPPPDSDGLLTAQEAAALNLDGTWLVVPVGLRHGRRRGAGGARACSACGADSPRLARGIC